MVLRLCRKGRQVLLSDREENSRTPIREGCNGLLQCGKLGPAITRVGLPSRAFKRTQCNTRVSTGTNRIAAHLRREGVRCINHMGDVLVSQVGHQPLDATKPAHPQGQGLGHGLRRTASIGKHGVEPGIGYSNREMRGFRCAAQ